MNFTHVQKHTQKGFLLGDLWSGCMLRLEDPDVMNVVCAAVPGHQAAYPSTHK